MTGDFSKISNGTQAFFKKKPQQDVPKNVADLAKEMMIFADKNDSAISQSQFQTRLAQMESLNTKDLIKFIRSFDKDESIIELICDEIGDDKKTRKEACLRVLNALVNSAKDVDLSDLKKQFEDELNSQFRFFGKYINTEKLDNIINAITQAIEDRQNFTKEEWQNLQNTSSAEGQKKANEVLEDRLEKAYSAFGERVGEDGEMTNVKKVLVNKKTGEKTEVKYEDGQMQRDGIAADIADGFSKIWNNEIFGFKNTADLVRKDLKIANAQLQELKKAQLEGEDAYKAKFKEIFGVEYDYTKHLSFQKNQEVYLKAAPKHELEMTFNRTFKTLLSNAPLRDEKEFVSADPSTNVMIETVTATKATVFKREYNNLVELMGENGEAILAELFEKKGVSNASLEDKFEVMKSFAKKWSNELHKETLEAGGGKSFSEIQAKYDNSYKAAYGVENDIMKRVNDYNTSQQIGGQVVKAGAVMAASMVAAFSGMGLVGVAGVTSGATIVSEVVDRGTSGKALNALKEEGFTAYVKTANDDIDWEATLKQAVISGGSVLIGGAVAKGVNFVMQGQTPIAQAVAMFGADVLTDAALEYVTTGTITIEGVAFAVALNAVGAIVAYKQLNAAADVANSADEAFDGAIAQPKVDAKTKLANAGFTDDVIANLKAQSDFYGPKLVDEVLDMIVYLEDQVAAGKPITKELIDGAIDLYSPGASGGSAYTQRTMIANTWNRGDEVFNAYGQKAPGQSTFSTGNMKAKYNKIKNGINDYIDYKKWEWGLDNPTAKTSAVDTSSPTTDFATKLADVKGPDGQPFLSKSEIDNLLENCQHGFVTDGKPIPDFEARIMAVLSNPEEIANLADWKSRSAGVWRAIQDPLQSTVDINPAAFGKSSVTTVGNKCILPQNMKYDSGNIGDVTVKVASGDMTAVKADAYLVPEFQTCASEGGVGAAIWRNGGGKGLEAYDNIIKTQGKQDFGSVHITESGGGNSQKLIHAVTVGSGAENEFEVVQKAVYNALKSAEEQGLSSVAMPALGTGIIGNLTNEQSAQAMMSAIRQFSNEGGQMDVTFVIYGSPKGYDGFVNTMKTGSYTSAVPTVGTREFDQARFLMGLANDGTDVDATLMAKNATADVIENVPVKSVTQTVQTSTLDLSVGMKVSDIDDFMLQCQAYANKNGLTVEVGKHKAFKDPVITFKDGSGNPVRELHYIGSELFDDTMITYNTKGQVVNETRYIASDGRFADNIQYFYDSEGNITYSTKLYDKDVIDVAIWENGRGMRQGAGVFYTQAEAKAKYGIDIDQSMIGSTNGSASTKPIPADIPTMPSIDDIATVLDDLPATSGATETQLSQIRKAARTSKYDSNVVLDMMQKYPDVVDKLTTFKAPDGSKLFSAQDISDILFNCKQTIETNPEKIFAILNNPKEIADIAGWKSRGAGVWRAIQDPLQSTVDINPAAFGAKPKVTTAAGATDFATKLADVKGPDGQPFLSKSEIDNLLENCQHGFVTDGKPIPDFEARIMAVLSNPEEIASLADWKSRSAGVWRAIQDPLQSTVDINPAAFGAKPKVTTAAGATDFATKLADVKGPDGQPFLSKSEIDNLLENCQHGFVTDGKPIPDFEARIMAVLSNPEEIASLADWKSRSAGVWRAIQDPLQSTVDINPAAFGAKPKVTTAVSSKASAIEMSVADRLAKEGVPVNISNKYSKAMDYISPYIVGNQDELAKFAKKYLANPEGFEKALKDIDMSAKEVDYRRHTYQRYGLARPEGFDNYELMHQEIDILTKLIDSILK